MPIRRQVPVARVGASRAIFSTETSCTALPVRSNVVMLEIVVSAMLLNASSVKKA